MFPVSSLTFHIHIFMASMVPSQGTREGRHVSWVAGEKPDLPTLNLCSLLYFPRCCKAKSKGPPLEEMPGLNPVQWCGFLSAFWGLSCGILLLPEQRSSLRGRIYFQRIQGSSPNSPSQCRFSLPPSSPCPLTSKNNSTRLPLDSLFFFLPSSHLSSSLHGVRPFPHLLCCSQDPSGSCFCSHIH